MIRPFLNVRNYIDRKTGNHKILVISADSGKEHMNIEVNGVKMTIPYGYMNLLYLHMICWELNDKSLITLCAGDKETCILVRDTFRPFVWDNDESCDNTPAYATVEWGQLRLQLRKVGIGRQYMKDKLAHQKRQQRMGS